MFEVGPVELVGGWEGRIHGLYGQWFRRVAPCA